jgi:hypothetical protein
MSQDYDIYKRFKHGYFAWVGTEPTRAAALKTVQRLGHEAVDGLTFVAVAKSLPTLRVIVRRRFGRISHGRERNPKTSRLSVSS